MLIYRINYQIINNILSLILSQLFNDRSVRALSNKKLS